MSFDGIVLKKVVDELNNIIGFKIDKIFQPDKNTIILAMYGNSVKLSLLACISSNNYRFHLTKQVFKAPSIAPNFCMFLRKHILGYKISNIYTKSLERIVYIDLKNPDYNSKKTLIIELMGKHSNIILVNENNIILDSLRHSSTEENAQRDIYPTSKYIEPKTNKLNLLDIKSFDLFYEKIKDFDDVFKAVLDTFNGISFSNLNALFIDNERNSYSSSKLLAHTIYSKLTELISAKNVSINVCNFKNDVPKDFYLYLKKSHLDFELNYALDDFYFLKENTELFENYRNTLLNLIFSYLKKYEKRLVNIDKKLSECNDMDKYKLYGELITANLYKLPKYNISEIELENYYDNGNFVCISLDKRFSPQINANHFFKKYSKLKNALNIVSIQKQETINDINYIESVIYELDNCSTIDEIQNIYDEISENDIFKTSFSSKKKKSKKPKRITTDKFSKFNPLKYVIDGYTILVGRNNIENDYLTNKFANKNDLWFHTKDIHGSHVILKEIPGGIFTEDIIYESAKLAVLHSKAKNSSNVPVDYCLVKYVKKLPGNKPGLVTYKNNKTVYVLTD